MIFDQSPPPPGHRYEGMDMLHRSNSQNNNINNNNCHQQQSKHRLQDPYDHDHGMAQVPGHPVDLFNYERACSVSSCNQDSSSGGSISGSNNVRKIGGSCSSGGGSSADASTDEDSELEYGPGIVAKLKSKFLRYSMKTDNKSGRIGIQQNGVYARGLKLKRCSSLENILEPASSCCVERHRIDILDHKDLLRVSRASATISPDDGISANVTNIGYSAIVTKAENEGNVLSNGVRLLNQRNLNVNNMSNGRTGTTTTTTTAVSVTTTPAPMPTAPVIRNYCLKTSPPAPAASNATAIGTPDHRDNNLSSSTPSIPSGKNITPQSKSVNNQVAKGVTSVSAVPAVNGITSRDNPFLKKYVNSCVAAATGSAGIKATGTSLVSAGNGRQGRGEPVPHLKETDPQTTGKEGAGASPPAAVNKIIQLQQVPRVTARRFQSNCKAKSNNKHSQPPQHYHVFGSSVVKRAKSMESLLFDAESRILPQDDDEGNDDEADAGERNREEEGRDRLHGKEQSEVASHEADHDVVKGQRDHESQDEGDKKKKETSAAQDQVQPQVVPVDTTAPVPVPACRPLPPIPQPSPRHPPPAVPPPPPPLRSSDSFVTSSSIFPCPADSVPTVTAGRATNSSCRVAIVPPIVHDTSPAVDAAADKAQCMTRHPASGQSPPHALPLHQQTTSDLSLVRNLVTPSHELSPAPPSSPSVCTENAAIPAAAPSSSLSSSLPSSDGTAETGKGAAAGIGVVSSDHAIPAITPPKAPARNSLLHKKQQQQRPSVSQDEGGEAAVKLQQLSSDKSSGSPLEGGVNQPLSAAAATLLPAPHQQQPPQPQVHERHVSSSTSKPPPAESGSVGVKRSLVRGSCLPPVKPMIAQKPKSLKVNPLDHLKAVSPTTTAPAAAPVPLLPPFILSSSVIPPPAVRKETVFDVKPQAIERQSCSKDKASASATGCTPAQRLLTPQHPLPAIATPVPADSSPVPLSATTTTTTAAAIVPSVPPIPPALSSPSSLASVNVTESLPKSSPSPCSSATTVSVPAADAVVSPADNHTSCTQSVSPFANSSTDILKALLDLHEQKPSMIISSSVNNKSNSNCMIFDFRGKNVKPQLAITSPFGRAAVIQATESDADADKADSPDSSDLSPTLIFLGENEIIGNGSLLKIRNKKLRIHFNETSLTSTYEYPSESSLCHQFDDRNQASNDSDACQSQLENDVSDRLQQKDQEAGQTTASETLIKPANSDEASSWSASSAASDLLF